MLTLSELIDQSTVITPERKKIYPQILKFMKPEVQAQLEAILVKEMEVRDKVSDGEADEIADINKKYLEKLDKLVSEGLRGAMSKQEKDEMNSADSLLEQLNNL